MLVIQGVVKLMLEALSGATPPLAPVLLIDVANVKQQQQQQRPGPAPHSPPRSCGGKLRGDTAGTFEHLQTHPAPQSLSAEYYLLPGILQQQNNPRTALNNLRSASARSSYFSSHNKDPSARNSFPSARNKAPSARNNAPSARNNPRLLAIIPVCSQ